MRAAIGRVAALAGIACLPSMSQAFDDCSEHLAYIDQRIENTDHPARNLQIALQMRQNIELMRAGLDAQTLSVILDSIDQMLPTESAGTPRPDRGVPAAAAAESADTTETSAPAAGLPSNALVATMRGVAPTGKSLVADYIDRPDSMHMFAIWDTPLDDVTICRMRRIISPDPRKTSLVG